MRARRCLSSSTLSFMATGWVLSGEGELLRSTTVQSEGSAGRTIRELLEDARKSMKVRGRDAMAGGGDELAHAGAAAAEVASEDGARTPGRDNTWRKKVKEAPLAKKKASTGEEEAGREAEMLRQLHERLVEPVEGALEGAREVLIIPHMELFEVRSCIPPSTLHLPHACVSA